MSETPVERRRSVRAPQRARPRARSSATCRVGFPDLADEHRGRRRARRERRRRPRARPALLRSGHGRPGHPGGDAAGPRRAASACATPSRRCARSPAASMRPVLVMTYWNPVVQYGVDRFADDLAAAGGAGLITPDLIPDEARRVDRGHPSATGLDRVFLAAPTSTDARLAPGGRVEPRVRLRRLDDGHHRARAADVDSRAPARSSTRLRDAGAEQRLRRPRHLHRARRSPRCSSTPTARSSAPPSCGHSPTGGVAAAGELAAELARGTRTQ